MLRPKGRCLKIVSCVIALCFFLEAAFPSFALSQPNFTATPQAAYVPAMLVGLRLDDQNPLLFNFLVSPGNERIKEQVLKEEVQKMAKYFLASLTIPRQNLWVNLSPYEQQRVIDEKFGQTDMGLDLLSQDYVLKQATASLVNPDSDSGKAFWDKVYKKAYEAYGRTDIDFDSLSRVWIVPDKAVLYRQGSSAYIVESSLKVMLDKDYLAMKHQGALPDPQRTQDAQDVSGRIMREIVIPQIEKEVNEGKDFSPLRQVYHALILADWFKRSIPENVINRVYKEKNKTAGIASYSSADAKSVYDQYVLAYRKGLHQKIVAEYDEHLKKYIPRKYFSGGVVLDDVPTQDLTDPEDLSSLHLGRLRQPVIAYKVIQNPVTSSDQSLGSSSPIVQGDFLSAKNIERIFDNEFSAKEFMGTLPQENRAWYINNLKDWVIAHAEEGLRVKSSGVIRWDFLMDKLVPIFEFSDEQAQEVMNKLGIEEKILDAATDSARLLEWQWIESLSTAHWVHGQAVARNLIAYLRLKKKQLSEEGFAEAFKSGYIIKENIVKSFSRVKDGYRLLPYVRQITKDTFFLTSSKTERVDQLMRIAEREVNVSTHKGQDLLRLSDLQKILENNHQRRRTGPNGTYDPEVTAALEELKILAENLAGDKQGAAVLADIKEVIEEYCGSEAQKDLGEAKAAFQRGKFLDYLSLLTKIRSQVYPLIVENIKQADAVNRSDSKRYGPHITRSEEKAEIAYRLMEADILLEREIVDFSTEAFSLIREALIAYPYPDNPKNIQDMILAVYVIAKNMAYAIGARPSLDVLAENLIKMRENGEYDQMDYYKIYGMIHQIQLDLESISYYLEKEFKSRIELLQKRSGVADYQDTPESLGFVQDFLRTTMLGQFSERFLLDCRKIIDRFEGSEELALATDLYAQQRVREIMDIPLDFDTFPRVMDYENTTEGQMKRIGSKVFGLFLMKKLGLSVPDFFVIRSDGNEPEFNVADVQAELKEHIAAMEQKTGKKLGDPRNPLLFSLRSVFPISMPGEFATVLNVGMNDKVVQGLKVTHGERFALRSYILFLHQYASLFQYGSEGEKLPELEKINFYNEKNTIKELKETIQIMEMTLFAYGVPLPQDPMEQIEIITDRIMNHGKSSEMRKYLSLHGVPESWKPSVIFQEMDFGYLEKDSYTAVVYSRNIHTGEDFLDAEVMPNAAGVDLVSRFRPKDEVVNKLPAEDEKLVINAKRSLERILKGPVEFEITRGKKLQFLQTRVAHLKPKAMIKVLADLVQEGILSQEEAASRIATFQEIIDQEAIISDKNVKPLVVAGGLAGGVMTGPIALSLEKAREFMEQGQNANLVLETTPAREDKSYYPSSRNVKLGVITKHGGKTQHFSIWANKFHMPYISMVNDIKIDPEGQRVKLGGKWFKEGDLITVDGYRGLIFEGDVIQKKEAEISSPVDLDASQQKPSDLGGIDLTQTDEVISTAAENQNNTPFNIQGFDIDHFEGFLPVILGNGSPRPLFEFLN